MFNQSEADNEQMLETKNQSQETVLKSSFNPYTSYLEIGNLKNEATSENDSILMLYDKSARVVYSNNTSKDNQHFINIKFN